MKVKDLVPHLQCSVHAEGDPEAEVSSGITGDLLSHIMGTAPDGAVWVTIQTHVNVAAVAVLKEMPMIVLACGRTPAPDLVERCFQEGICLVSSPMSAFSICTLLGAMGLRG